MNPRFALGALILLVLAIAVVGMWSGRTGETGDPVVTPPPPSVTEDAAPLTAALRYEPPKAVRQPSPEERRRLLALPNGEFVPALNGVIDAPALGWDPARPYAPIVGVERDPRGHEWYVHADGTKSTTQMVYRSDTGRLEGSSSTAHPERSAAILPGELPEPGGEPARK